MKEVKTGRGVIPGLTLIAIWSISLVVDLPGLAITPLLDSLRQVFPDATVLEIQQLTVLPNFLIIPFILLSGRISVSRSPLPMLVAGLAIYLIAGLLYFTIHHIVGLLLVSCLLGIGAGLIIPLASGLLASTFDGPQRMQQLGINSGIANFSLIVATGLVGWLATLHWRAPFAVYLLPVIPLIMSFLLRKKYFDRNHRPIVYPRPETATASPAIETYRYDEEIVHLNYAPPVHHHATRHLIEITLLYFLLTICTMSLSYYLPFRMSVFHLDSERIGITTAVFYLGITLPGLLIAHLVKLLRSNTVSISLLLTLIGFAMLSNAHLYVQFLISSLFVGFGYGVLQPVIFDKAAGIARPHHETQHLSIVLAANFAAVAVAPFFDQAVRLFLGLPSTAVAGYTTFPFMIAAIVLAILTIVCTLRPHDFAFKMEEKYYAASTTETS